MDDVSFFVFVLFCFSFKKRQLPVCRCKYVQYSTQNVMQFFNFLSNLHFDKDQSRSFYHQDGKQCQFRITMKQKQALFVLKTLTVHCICDNLFLKALSWSLLKLHIYWLVPQWQTNAVVNRNILCHDTNIDIMTRYHDIMIL